MVVWPIIREWVRWHRTPVVVIRPIASDCCQPTSKPSTFSQRGKPKHRFQKDILNQVIDIAQRDLREQNAVDHPGVTFVEAPKCRPVAVPRRTHQHRIVGDFRRGSFPHGPTSQARREHVSSIS
jgi:hypothetical protein